MLVPSEYASPAEFSAYVFEVVVPFCVNEIVTIDEPVVAVPLPCEGLFWLLAAQLWLLGRTAPAMASATSTAAVAIVVRMRDIDLSPAARIASIEA